MGSRSGKEGKLRRGTYQAKSCREYLELEKAWVAHLSCLTEEQGGEILHSIPIKLL